MSEPNWPTFLAESREFAAANRGDLRAVEGWCRERSEAQQDFLTGLYDNTQIIGRADEEALETGAIHAINRAKPYLDTLALWEVVDHCSNRCWRKKAGE